MLNGNVILFGAQFLPGKHKLTFRNFWGLMRELLKFTASDHLSHCRVTLAILHPKKAFIIIPGEHACMSCFHGYSLHIPEFVLSYHLHLLVRSLTGVLMSPEFVLSHPTHLLVRSLTGVLLSPEFVLSHSMHLLVRSLTGAQA